jgi:hypothetical protein
VRVGWYRARAAFRGRGGGPGLALLSGVLVALVLGGVAGSRRTERAFDQMLDAYVQPNAVIFAFDPANADEVYAEASERLDDMPDVRAHGSVATALVAQEDGRGRWIGELAFSSVDGRGYRDIQRPLLVDGRRADPSEPYEVEVNEAWAELHGIEAGDSVRLGLVPPEQLDAAGNGVAIELQEEPRSYLVAGVIRRPGDLAPERRGVEGTIDEGAESLLYLSAAFWSAHGDDVASYGSGVAVQVAGNDVDGLAAAFADVGVEVVAEGGESGAAIPAIERGVDIEARALLGATAVLGIVGVLLLAQAARRQGVEGSEALGAIGFDRRSLAVAGAVELGIVGVLAAATGVAGAVFLSQLAPIGISRRSARSFGVHVDAPVMAIGAALVVLGFVVGGAVLGWTAPRRLARRRTEKGPSRLARGLAASRIGPAPAIGIRLATEPGRGDRAVAVRSTLATGVLGVAALTAAVTFSSSLDRVVDDPRYRGWNWDLDVGNFSDDLTALEGRSMLLANDGVAEFTGWQSDFIELDGTEHPLVMLDERDGAVGPQVLEGRMPSGPGEIALASATLDQLGRSVGERVEAVGPSGEAQQLRIVGESMGVGVIDQTAAIDEGAVLTFSGARPMMRDDMRLYANGYLVRLAGGEVGQRGVAQLREDFPGTVFGARSTFDIENLRRVQWLPRLLAGGVALLALGSMAHALVGAVRWRRRELALLKCLGLRPRQLVDITVVQATTVAVIALAVGLPLGVALARGLWTPAAEEIGTFAGAVIPPAPLALGGLALLVLAVAIALVPGRSAARTPTAAVLRVE